ncbi:MAG: hypothetical protein JNK15_01470 [Planctomycetes bacterium]|nr:hypothetical protein [Planctomycetota bacterium]
MRTLGSLLPLFLAPFAVSGVGPPAPLPTHAPATVVAPATDPCACEYGYIAPPAPGGGLFVVEFLPGSVDGSCTAANPPCEEVSGCEITVHWHFITPLEGPDAWETWIFSPSGEESVTWLAEEPDVTTKFAAHCGRGYTWFFPEVGEGGQWIQVLCTHCDNPH